MMDSCVKAGGGEAPCDFIVNPKNNLWCFFPLPPLSSSSRGAAGPTWKQNQKHYA